MIWRRVGHVMQSQAGYSLIELLAVMGIISVLTALVVANTSIGDKRQQLRDAVAGYVTAAKQAETLAASSQPVSDGSTSTPRLAYGVCLTSSAAASGSALKCQAPSVDQKVDTYQVYARRSTDTILTDRPDQPDIIATFTVPRSIEFQAAAASIWLDYKPPGPSLLANGLTTAQTVEAIVTNRTEYKRQAGIRPGSGSVYVK